MQNEAKNEVTVSQYVDALRAAFADRKAYEEAQLSKDNIFLTLAKLEKAVTRESIASVFLAHNIDAHLLVNRQLNASKRINVYTIDKCENVASAIAKSEQLNHFSRALLLTAKRFADNDALMTREDAHAACNTSAKLKDAKREKLLVRTARHVSAATASAQSSSSIDALCQFNVLQKTYDKENNLAYRLNADSDATKALLERCA